MEVVIQFNSCKDCPFKTHVYEQGFCGEVCEKSSLPYASIADNGVRSDCPFKSRNA